MYSFKDYFNKGKKAWDIVFEQWSEEKVSKNLVRVMRCQLPVKGVPFLSSTRLEKHFELKENSKDCIDMYITNKSLDVPYGSAFHNLERWTICSPLGGEKAIIRFSSETVFVQSTMFQSKISKASREGFQDYASSWLQEAKEAGVFTKKKPDFVKKKKRSTTSKPTHSQKRVSSMGSSVKPEGLATSPLKDQQVVQPIFDASIIRTVDAMQVQLGELVHKSTRLPWLAVIFLLVVIFSRTFISGTNWQTSKVKCKLLMRF